MQFVSEPKFIRNRFFMFSSSTLSQGDFSTSFNMVQMVCLKSARVDNGKYSVFQYQENI